MGRFFKFSFALTRFSTDPGKGTPQKDQRGPHGADDPGGAFHHQAADGEIVDDPSQGHPQQDEVSDLAVAVFQHEAEQHDAGKKKEEQVLRQHQQRRDDKGDSGDAEQIVEAAYRRPQQQGAEKDGGLLGHGDGHFFAPLSEQAA